MWCLQKAFQLLCLVLFFLNLQANLSSSSSITQLCSHNEASALIQFKSSFSINETSSRYCGINISYAKTDSWKEGTNCCSWDGVTCDNITGRVIGLDLSCSRLYGTIPSNSTLFHLLHLQKLNLAFNDFNHSKMSSKFGEFVSLVYLNLSSSNFAGQVPSQISHLSKLVSLDLSRVYDRLYGHVDQTLDRHNLEGLVHNLTEVRELILDGINMSSINPNVFANLSSSLRSLSLYLCRLRGKFPENIFHLPNIKTLELGYNKNLSLNLPQFNRSSHLEFLDLSAIHFPRELIDSIGNLVSLKQFYARDAQISGDIPKTMGNLSELNALDLMGNYLSGQIPSSLVKSLLQLEYLGLGSNQLGGSIPDEVNAFPNLFYLELSDNLFNGTLPSWLYTIPSLVSIFLSHNRFSGPIPSSISQLLNLSYLDLSSNNLSGIVEFDMFSKLQNLGFLYLSSNKLSLIFNGTSADYTLPNLEDLYLSSCNVSEFPQFLRGSKRLQNLDLSNNRINGKIPMWMENFSLIYLNLSHNSLTDVNQILPWKEIQVLDLSSNLIHGDLPIPPWTTNIFFISNNSLSGEISSLICNASSLEFLDLSLNNLSGIVPQCLGNLSQSISMLNLRMNKLHGIIPPTFTKGCQLKNLNLNSNKLEGPLTRSILNCTSLEVLDLGNNKIKDAFPHWLGSLPQLKVLILRSNQLQGSIHDSGSSSSFSKIQIFDLSSNYFTGRLPMRYIRDFKAMINLTFDQSANQYMGVTDERGKYYTYSIGMEWKGLEMQLVKIFTMLTSIDLSNNKFQEEIPEVIGNLKSLKGLNLSYNNLNGCIPDSMGNLIDLEWLDLSSNKLVREIPGRLLDLTFLSVFNVSDNQLQGQIPQGRQFGTFGNDSYEGNSGLCGFPVSKGCSRSEPPPSNLVEEDGSKSNFGFGWKVVLIGYGCGVVFGWSIGYVVFQTGKPKWFVAFVEDQHRKRQKTPKIRNRRGGQRRT